ncbi:LmeA family phospholipid-binding protein [Streptomyces sp. S.PB5]|nr:LmeA family phospholipid-binding protein [Streptomyces sp. S.PB5]MDN3028309.1 LmeA family phospholipid-binding protein [Streptomyces sp. S.PB5]
MGTPQRPSVDVRGFPVLTQLASGTLRHVDITAEDIPAHGTSVPDHPGHRAGAGQGARRPPRQR